ncbi:hypothetical protein MLD38_030111 [Melastoma candidum]|uniref:Uncharacterized protein n=1 Tax=Melastoma candidum TaxID=119954 RepID=A0ACB9MKC1_9MYRT|nr:hypothetical protein MLD38_030111 [Melastoma candidum]
MVVQFINCSPGQYDALGEYARVLEAAQDDIILETGRNDGNLYTEANKGTTICYAHGKCTQDITSQQCSNCLRAVRIAMNRECRNSIGAHCKVGSCEFRYEEYEFDDG